jgi:hypothetical protein
MAETKTDIAYAHARTHTECVGLEFVEPRRKKRRQTLRARTHTQQWVDLEFVEPMRKIATVPELTVVPAAAAHVTPRQKKAKGMHTAENAHTSAVGVK